jgi:hypothetical protein
MAPGARVEHDLLGAVTKQATAALDAQTKDTFKEAWGACLEGRGYGVK